MISISSGELTSDPSYPDCSDINPASVDCVPFVLILSLPHFRFSGISVYACYKPASSPSISITCKTTKSTKKNHTLKMRSFMIMAFMALLAFVAAMPITPSAPQLQKRAEQFRLEGLREVHYALSSTMMSHLTILSSTLQNASQHQSSTQMNPNPSRPACTPSSLRCSTA